MRIAMIGAGYVGLVSGACIADFGHEVTCVDKDGTKISALNSGEIPIYEPGLKDIVQSNVRQGRLRFTTALGKSTFLGAASHCVSKRRSLFFKKMQIVRGCDVKRNVLV